jgi:hypothetical protein
MLRKLSLAFLVLGTVAAQDFLRVLAGGPPKFYDQNATIAFSSTLGCGSCIRGGYIHCIPGTEG